MLENTHTPFDEMLAKKKAFYQRMRDDIDFRLKQVDKKLHTMNALSGEGRYVRYKLVIHDTITKQEYTIGETGEFKEID